MSIGDSVSAVVRPSIVYGKGMFNPSVGAWTYSSGFTFTETSAHRTTVICAEDELSEICKSHFFEDTFQFPRTRAHTALSIHEQGILSDTHKVGTRSGAHTQDTQRHLASCTWIRTHRKRNCSSSFMRCPILLMPISLSCWSLSSLESLASAQPSASKASP